jgi:MraZ protein
LTLFFGAHDVGIDDKNRMPVPADIRRAIDPETDGEAFFLVPGINQKLWLYPEKYYKSLALQIHSEMAPGEDQIAFDQLNFAMASRVEWDRQGRILIPEKYIRKSGLNKEVTVVGMRDHIEVWNRSDWAVREEEIERRRAEITFRSRQKS